MKAIELINSEAYYIKEFKEAARLIKNGVINPSKIITRKFSLLRSRRSL